MAENSRLKGVRVPLPFVYGSQSYYLNPNFDSTAAEPSPLHTHKWKVFLRPFHKIKLKRLISKVQFKLHDSYENSVRDVFSPPYEIEETGWGEFEIVISIFFNDNLEKCVTFTHLIKLFPAFISADEPLPSVDRPLIVENYDELVFVDPYKTMYEIIFDMLEKNESLKNCELHESVINPKNSVRNWDEQKNKQIELINTCNEQIVGQIIEVRETFNTLKEKCLLLNEELKTERNTTTQPENTNTNQNSL